LREELAATQRQIKRAFGSEALGASQAAAGILTGLAAAFGLVGAASVKMAGDMQATEKAFETLLGGSQKAKDFLADLAQFAAETPFELKGLQETAKRLLAFRFAAEDIIPIMTVIGDAAGMLGSGQEGIDRMVTAISQISAKGKVQAEEVMQLAEAGVNAWQYLADSMGMSIAEVMDKVSKGEVDAQTGINAILLGMQRDFKGGMEQQAKEIPGLYQTITDNVAAVMREAGKQITDELNIKGQMQELADYLSNFAAYVKQSGINQALKDLIPKELSLAIFAVAGALVAAAIPAIYSFAVATWAAIAPLAPFIAAGAALGAVAWVIWQAWEPLGDLFSNTWTRAVAYTQQKWAEIKVIVLSGVQSVLSALQPIFNLFGGGLASAAAGWLSNVSASLASASAEAEAAAKRGEDAGRAMSEAWGKAKDSLVGGVKDIVSSTKELKKTFTGLSNASNVDLGGGNAAKKAAKEWQKLEQKAQQVSESIEREWVQTTKTQLEQLDIWRAEQLAALEEIKAANENYERDKERVQAVYSARRTKILQQEAQEALNTFRSIRDGWMSIQKDLYLGGLSGADKDIAGMAFNYADKVKGVQDFFDKISKDYATANETQKQTILSTLDQLGIAYEKTADDRLNFDKAAAKASAAYQKQYMKDVTDYYATCKDIQAGIDAAFNSNSLAQLQAVLTEENVMRLNNYEAQKSMMQTYLQAYRDAHAITAQLIADLYEQARVGLQTAFSDILMGAQSAKDAFESLGKSMLKVIADYYAKKLSGMITVALFGKKALATETALSVAAGAEVAAAWAKAAAMVSLATFGANAGPAMAGISATTALAIGLSNVQVPGFATGGITTGPTLAMIGEGRYQEAVLPLNKRTLEKVGLIDDQPRQPVIMQPITIQAWDGKSVERWLESGGGRKLEKYFTKRAREFAPLEVGT